MLTKPVNWREPKVSEGQCPVCEWWFDGPLVGAGDPATDTAPIVEWAFDAARFGRCVKRACWLANNLERPVLETPRRGLATKRHRDHKKTGTAG